MFTVQVRTPLGDLLNINLNEDDATFGRLREEIFRLYPHIPIAEQKLATNGSPLVQKDSAHLEEINLTGEVALRKRVASLFVDMNIPEHRFVQTAYIDADDTVEEVIRSRGCDPATHELILNGVSLSHNLPLSFYDVRAGNTLHISHPTLSKVVTTPITMCIRAFKTTIDFVGHTTGLGIKRFFVRESGASVLIICPGYTVMDDSKTLADYGVKAGAEITLYDIGPDDVVCFIDNTGNTPSGYVLSKKATIESIFDYLGKKYECRVSSLEFRDNTTPSTATTTTTTPITTTTTATTTSTVPATTTSTEQVSKISISDGKKFLGNFPFIINGVQLHLKKVNVPLAPPEEFYVPISGTPAVLFLKGYPTDKFMEILRESIKNDPNYSGFLKHQSLKIKCGTKKITEDTLLSEIIIRDLEIEIDANVSAAIPGIDIAKNAVGKKPNDVVPSNHFKQHFPTKADEIERRNYELKAIYWKSRDEYKRKFIGLKFPQKQELLKAVTKLTFNKDPVQNQETQYVVQILVSAFADVGTILHIEQDTGGQSLIRAIDCRPGTSSMNFSIFFTEHPFGAVSNFDTDLAEFTIRKSISDSTNIPIEEIVLMNVTSTPNKGIQFDVLIPMNAASASSKAKTLTELMYEISNSAKSHFRTTFAQDFIGLRVCEQLMPSDILVLSTSDFDSAGNAVYDDGTVTFDQWIDSGALEFAPKNLIFKRGGKDYYLPEVPWRRFGFSVRMLYERPAIWLRHNGEAGEWAVGFHGINGIQDAMMHKNAGGIWLCSKLDEIKHRKTKCHDKYFHVALQCRYDPKEARYPNDNSSNHGNDSGNNSGNSSNSFFVRSSQHVRPYGFLIKPVEDDESDDQ